MHLLKETEIPLVKRHLSIFNLQFYICKNKVWNIFKHRITTDRLIKEQTVDFNTIFLHVQKAERGTNTTASSFPTASAHAQHVQ